MWFLLVLVNGGCAGSSPPPSGFLDDYSRLEKQDDGALRYISPALTDYSSFLLDPVQMRAEGELKPEEAAAVARYFNEALSRELLERGYTIADRPDVGVARVRVAITNIQESSWFLSLHPASKLTGAGTGGASMEGEVADSVTGEQLAAVIQAGRGNQFELDTFSRLDDVKDTIDHWAENAARRLGELRRRR